MITILKTSISIKEINISTLLGKIIGKEIRICNFILNLDRATSKGKRKIMYRSL